MKSAGPTSRAAASTRSHEGRSGSRSMCLWRFSIITIAASIMAPMAIAIPPSDMMSAPTGTPRYVDMFNGNYLGGQEKVETKRKSGPVAFGHDFAMHCWKHVPTSMPVSPGDAFGDSPAGQPLMQVVVSAHVVVPFPNWPKSFRPQVQTVPSVFRAAAWDPPVAAAVTPNNQGTCIGVVLPP